MEGAIISLLQLGFAGLPLDTINACANTVTAAAVLWAARSLRRSLTDVRLLHLQGPFTSSQALEDEELERMWRTIKERRVDETDEPR